MEGLSTLEGIVLGGLAVSSAVLAAAISGYSPPSGLTTKPTLRFTEFRREMQGGTYEGEQLPLSESLDPNRVQSPILYPLLLISNAVEGAQYLIYLGCKGSSNLYNAVRHNRESRARIR